MEVLNIEPTDETPGVMLDASNNNFVFKGRSLPEDVTQFYTPILDWLQEYAKNPNPKTDVTFRLDYFNTASSKMILDMLMVLEEVQTEGKEVLINWYYMDGDEDMEEAGEEFQEIVELPFEIQAS